MAGKIVLNHRNTTFFRLFPMTCVSKSLHIFTRIIRRRKKPSSFYVVVLKVKLSSSKAERRMLRAERWFFAGVRLLHSQCQCHAECRLLLLYTVSSLRVACSHDFQSS